MRVNSESPQSVTGPLLNWQNGEDKSALAKLMALVYQELWRVARADLQRERGDHTLQATALVHEVYLRMVDDKQVSWTDRGHSYGIAARLMRQILIRHAHAYNAAKRGGSSPQSLSLLEGGDTRGDCALELMTVLRDWSFVRLWLSRELRKDAA